MNSMVQYRKHAAVLSQVFGLGMPHNKAHSSKWPNGNCSVLDLTLQKYEANTN
jgi:hypothetical protein